MKLTIDVMATYLGKPSATMLAASPFDGWRFKRSVETDLNEIVVDYVSDDGGIDILADRRDTVGTIFLYSENDRTFAGNLADVPATMTRRDVVAMFGDVSKSGEGIDDPILGRTGAWDRFDMGHYVMHFEYTAHTNIVSKIALGPRLVHNQKARAVASATPERKLAASLS